MSRIVIILFSLISCFAMNLAYAIPFPEWLVSQANTYVDSLKKENEILSAADIARIEQRLKEAKAQNNWTNISTEYAHLVGKNPERFDYWLDLSIALQKRNAETPDWKIQQAAQSAAIIAYQLSEKEKKDKQAVALLVYGNLLNPEPNYESPSYQEVITEIKSLADLNELRKQHPELSDFMSFKFLNVRLNNVSSKPSVCFVFSHPLAIKNIQFNDYIHTQSNADLSYIASGREVCVAPLKYGDNYDVIIKKGLISAYGEKLAVDAKVSFKVKDQNSRLSFSNKAYIMMREDVTKIPLTSVNVDSVNIKILYISDRGMNEIFSGSSNFLKTLREYEINDIKNEQGELIWQGDMELGGAKNQTLTKQIPFNEVVKKTKPGVYLIQAEEKGALYGEKAYATQWLIVSDLGITTFSSKEGGVTAQLRSLKTAEPISGVEVTLLAHNNAILSKATTDRNGLIQFDSAITRGEGGNRPSLLLAYGNKGDFSFLDLSQAAFDLSDRGVGGRTVKGPLDAYLYTEQGVYRPGSTLHLNALLRDNLGVAKGNLPLTFIVLRPDNVEVARYTVTGNLLGFYEVAIPLLGSARTGSWRVDAYLDPKSDAIGQVNFSVEDFVPSRLLVTLKANEIALTPNAPLNVNIKGRYLFGADAAGVEGNAVMILREQENSFPEYAGFTFGLQNESFLLKQTPIVFPALNDKGESTLEAIVDKTISTSKPLEAIISVTLADLGGRPEIGSLTLPLRIQPYLIGIKPNFKDKRLSEEEATASFEIIAVDKAGKLLPSKEFQYDLYELDVNYTWYQPQTYGAWEYKTTTEDKFLAKGVIQIDENGRGRLDVPVPQSGQYRIEIRDNNTQIASSLEFSKGWYEGTAGNNTPDKLSIQTDKPSYLPNETIQLNIQAPFEGEALITFANDRVLETRNVSVSKKGSTVKLTMKPEWGTGVYCLVSAFRPLSEKTSTKNYLPKRAVGIAWLGINKLNNNLNISMKLPEEVLPRQTIDVPIEIKLADDGRVSKNMQVSVFAVDEGILKLTEFHTPNPNAYFFDKRNLGVDMRDVYGKLIDPISGEMGVLRVGGDAGALSRNLQALSKKSFKVVSLYSGLVALENGRGTIKLAIPEFNGTLRIMAVAFDEKRLGSQENALLVRDPIIIEGTLPRFLAPEDKSVFSLSLFNTKAPVGEYKLNLATSGSIQIEGDKNHIIHLEKDGKYQTQIPVIAKGLGDGKITISLTSTAVQDKPIAIQNEFEISVRPTVAYQNKSVNQWLKSGETITLNTELLSEFVKESENVTVNWTTQVPWDTTALLRNLATYQYGCVEQTTSKGFGGLVGGLIGSPADKLANSARVNQALAVLSEKQNPNGSYNLWFNANDKVDIWLTAYVVDFFQHANAAGFDVPRYTLERSLDCLANYVASHSNDTDMDYKGVAYALYVLGKTDKIESGTIRYFYDSYYEKLDSPFARAMLGAALAEKGDLARADKAFTNAYTFADNAAPRLTTYYASVISDRAGVLVMASESLRKMPTLKFLGDVIESHIQTLADQIKDVSLLSTQEDAWLLLAANAIQSGNKTAKDNLAEKEKTNLQILVNDKAINLTDSTATGASIAITRAELEQGIKIQNSGSTNVWQHVTISGLSSATPMAENHGLEISRRYYDSNGTEISPLAVAHGTSMIVVLEGKQLDAESRQLLLIDLLPAGFEIESTRLQGNGAVLYPWLDKLSKTDYMDGRDDRFVSSLWLSGDAEQFKVAYLVRAVSLGKFIHPGFFVEAMYAPNIFARTAESVSEVMKTLPVLTPEIAKPLSDEVTPEASKKASDAVSVEKKTVPEKSTGRKTGKSSKKKQ